LFDLGNPTKKKSLKRNKNAVLLAKKTWWHMPKKEVSRLSNSPPNDKKSENRLKRVLESVHKRMNSHGAADTKQIQEV
jgi:hypothetical protein